MFLYRLDFPAEGMYHIDKSGMCQMPNYREISFDIKATYYTYIVSLKKSKLGGR